MPIRPEQRKLYPPREEWKAIREAILTRAGDCCEGSPRWPSCRARNGEPHPATGSRVILTIAHFPDPAPGNVAPGNLHAWCQRCHNGMDAAMRSENRRRNNLQADQSLALSLEE